MQPDLFENINSRLDYWSKATVKGHEPAVVLMSGGQDSTTCLAVALARHDNVHPLAFDYGQKHSVELEQAQTICDGFGLDLTVVKIPALSLMTSSALVNGGDVNQPHDYLDDVPATFVPARNAMFLTVAWGFAMEMQARRIYIGVCQTDYSGYPDCREDFIDKMNAALIAGYQTHIGIYAPLMGLDKAATFELAARLGVFRTVVQKTHTCYNGDRSKTAEWGAGCGTCPACNLRKQGHAEWLKRYNS